MCSAKTLNDSNKCHINFAAFDCDCNCVKLLSRLVLLICDQTFSPSNYKTGLYMSSFEK